jgi:hypothetical protein
MVDWLQTVATASISAATAYGVAAARVVREEGAKTRAVERGSLPGTVSNWIAEAEAVRRGMDTGIEYADSITELYNSYRDCSRFLQNSRRLARWERYLIRMFCIEAFGRAAYQTAVRIPMGSNNCERSTSDSTAIIDRGSSGEETVGPRLSRMNVILGIFRYDGSDGKQNLVVKHGRISSMRRLAGDVNKGNKVAEKAAWSAMHANRIVKICERIQYPKLWHVIPAIFVAIRESGKIGYWSRSLRRRLTRLGKRQDKT